MTLQEAKEKVASEMGYNTWDFLIATCCGYNTPQVIYEAETKVNKILPNLLVIGSLPSDGEIEDAHDKMISISNAAGFVNGAKWMRDKWLGNDR